MELENKRKRQPNFSLKERCDLFNIISTKYSKIIENKATDKVSMIEKEDTWNLVLNDFNSTSETGLFRDKECLKRLYENRKREIRKIMARNKQEISKTGGGKATKTELDAADEILQSVMNTKTVTGLDSPFDSDSASKSKLDEKQDEFVLKHKKNYYYDTDEDINQNSDQNVVVIEYCSDNDENLNMDEVMESSFVNEEIMEHENEDISEVENKEKIRPTFKKASDFKLPKTPTLRVPYLQCNKVKQGEKQETTRRHGRRILSVQPTGRRTGIQIMSSSHIAEKYDEILDQRKILLAKQIEIADQELSFQKVKNKLEIEILTKKAARENN